MQESIMYSLSLILSPIDQERLTPLLIAMKGPTSEKEKQDTAWGMKMKEIMKHKADLNSAQV